MSARQEHFLRFLTPIPTLTTANTPERLTTTVTRVRSAIIFYPRGQTGRMFISDTEANATTLNRFEFNKRGDFLEITPDNFANLDGVIDLREVWMNGLNAGRQLIVAYIEHQEHLE